MRNKKWSSLCINVHKTLQKYLPIAAGICAIIIAIFVLFSPPMPGVADQGDFQRVMTVTGLEETGKSSNTHWFKYVTTEYNMIPLKLSRLIGIIPTTSMIYPISIARLICNIAAMQYFSTKVLALVYAIIYIEGLYLCLKCINFERIGTSIFFVILSLLILMDGNYLVWFNSLYGEPMMICGLLLFTASVLYTIKYIDELNTKKIIFVFISAFLFLGAKMQCFSALPIIILIVLRLASIGYKNTWHLKIKSPISLLIFLLIFYVGGIYIQINSSCGIDTQYNSVFYGILKNSENPKKDLAVLGLPPDMAVEAGKHAYLSKDKYVKYTPGSNLTKNEFNKKISNFKLLEFYLLQPDRFIKGMQYTASQCFDTGGSLGKYEEADVKDYTYKLNRFTLWSNFRNSKLPKKLIFIIFFYILVISISIIEHIKNKNNMAYTLGIELLWAIMLIGILQFPMPYIGNGEADTAKQLFLFNYTFDITFLVACTWIFNKILNIYSLLKLKTE